MNTAKNLPVDYDLLDWRMRKSVREEYIKLQDGKCFFCKSDLSSSPSKEVFDKKVNWSLFPDNFLKHPVHLQHCHKTGLTEGAVHALCNAVWWQYHGR